MPSATKTRKHCSKAGFDVRIETAFEVSGGYQCPTPEEQLVVTGNEDELVQMAKKPRTTFEKNCNCKKTLEIYF